jgi:alcohol dehydrogenase class IV
MESLKNIAKNLLSGFKGANYIHGMDCLNRTGELTQQLGKRVSLVAVNTKEDWARPLHESVMKSLNDAGMVLAGETIEGASPNAPKEDVFRICDALRTQHPDVVVSVGGGSSIDATKAAIAYLGFADMHPDLNDYFGNGPVSAMIQATGRKLLPLVAVQVSASSAAHLTKYSNITDLKSMQKMLIVDEALVPVRALFDYSISVSQPAGLTMDGGLDGISHCLEVFMGCPEGLFERAKEVCLPGIELIVNNLKRAIESPANLEAREAIGLGTDLGGYAIMIGGTNGAHLNSFSMTDILTHGRAVALMNPYYVVFFSTAIEDRLRMVARIYKNAGYFTGEINSLHGRELGIALANAMMNLSKDIGFPTTLVGVKGFGDEHIQRCLTAAKNPKLDSKLKNMPVPLSADLVDAYMLPILQAAKSGNLELIRNFAG